MQAKIPMVYNKEHYTVMANDIVRGKQEMSLQEARIIRLLITQVVKEDKDLKTYSCSIKDLATFLEIDDSNLYRDIKTICENLLQRIVRVESGDPKKPWKAFQWVQKAEYDGAGTITLMLSEQISPYVLELDRYFTQYQLENVLYMNSFYAIRLYELLRADCYTLSSCSNEYSVNFLRTFFSCEDKYKLYGDFKRRVLEVAVKEINSKADIEIINMNEYKTGRRITSVEFQVKLTDQHQRKI